MTQIHKIWNEQGELIEVEGDIDDLLDSNWLIRRLKTYDLHHQMNCLYDDIQAGLFGEAAKTGSFIAYLDLVKQQFPKN
jgi:hypothetical protein